MATVDIAFVLSAPARKAVAGVNSPRSLEFIADRFFDKLRHERYRDFAVAPQYYTNPQGARVAKKSVLRPRGEKVQTQRVRVPIETLQKMKRFEARGLSLNWLMEEILYFGFCEGFLENK